MKKTFIALMMLLSVNLSFAALPSEAPKQLSPAEQKAMADKALMEKVVTMSVQDYEALTGEKMNFFDRLAFKVTKARFEKKLKKAEELTSGFNIGGFALGFLLGLLGVLIAYIASKDSNLRKWSWIGLGSVVALSLLLLLL